MLVDTSIITISPAKFAVTLLPSRFVRTALLTRLGIKIFIENNMCLYELAVT